MTSTSKRDNSTGYRPDIQGLRAIAVLLVLTFHAGLPVVGGFIGVDVFFVISGYVITNMLLREWSLHNSISLGRFWRRRFFRLSPALALVIAVTFIFTALLLLPLQQQVSYQTGVGALFFVANIVIARNTGGYFDAPAEANPLLNTWSLSVEEQFYFLFPLLLVAGLIASRHVRRSLLVPFVIVASIACVSFALAIVGSGSPGEAPTWLNFYSPVTRSWEFAVGSLIALATFQRSPLPTGAARSLRWIGGLALLAGAFVIDDQTPFPGVWTLLPVAATALLLIGGNSTGGRPRLLTHTVLIRIGDWSYSIYLWHWPAIVFAIAVGVESVGWLFLIAVLSLVPAALSYRFVETPLRHWSPPQRRTRALAVVAVLLPPALLVPVLTVAATPSPRLNGTVGTTYLDEIWATSHPCTLDQESSSGSRCFQSKESGSPELFIIGDSHAEDLYLGFSKELSETNVGYVYLPDWPYRDSENARNTFAQISTLANLRAVVINSRWDSSGARSDAVKSAVEGLSTSGVSVFLADDRPVFSFHAEKCLYESLAGPRAVCSEDASEFVSRYEAYRPELHELSQSYSDVYELNTSGGFCDESTCSMVAGEDLLYADAGHLNELGSRGVASKLLRESVDLKSALAK